MVGSTQYVVQARSDGKWTTVIRCSNKMEAVQKYQSYSDANSGTSIRIMTGIEVDGNIQWTLISERSIDRFEPEPVKKLSSYNPREILNEHFSQYAISLTAKGKSMVVAYLLWWFFGVLGIHRLYLNRAISAFCMMGLAALGWLTLFTTWIVLGCWWVVDGFLIYQYVNKANEMLDAPLLGISLTSNKTASEQNDAKSLDYLEKLHKLKESGAISDIEYQERKNKVEF
jgi:TM2 domain-containing membrane protein YozV